MIKNSYLKKYFMIYMYKVLSCTSKISMLIEIQNNIKK